MLSGAQRHELACSSCGAPLHDLKMLPKSKKGDRELVRHSPVRMAQPAKVKPHKHKPKKRKRPRWGKVLEEAFDLIEDIFD